MYSSHHRLSNEGSSESAHMRRLASIYALLTYTQGLDEDENSDPNFRPLALMGTWTFVIGICAYAVNTEISRAGSYAEDDLI